MKWDLDSETTETEDPNVVSITIRYNSTNYTFTDPECYSGTGYLPWSHPI